MKANEQKLILENLLSATDVYSRCSGILSGEYFDPEYRNPVNFIQDYYKKYSALPDFETINAKYELGLKSRAHALTADVIAYTCNEVEIFCKERAMINAVHSSMDLIEEGKLGEMMEAVKKAFEVSLQRDLGIEQFDNPEKRLRSLLDTEINYPTGIAGLDEHIGGGLAKKQLCLFSANSGVGKSVMLSNLAINYAIGHGFNVVYITLELPEDMIFLRNSYIISGVDAGEWKEKIAAMSSAMTTIRREGAGTIHIKELPGGATANDIRSYLKQYKLDTGDDPDVVCVDYLDMMRPNAGSNKNLAPHEQDKLKSEELYDVIKEVDAIGITASQQNRGALENSAPTQGVIAGGMTKVNTVDVFVSLQMDPVMRARGEMIAHFLKTRSASGVGKSAMLTFDATCLRITDGNGKKPTTAAIMKKRKLKKDAEIAAAEVVEEKFDLPGLETEDKPMPNDRIEKFMDTADKNLGLKLTIGAGSERKAKNVEKLVDDKPVKVAPAKKIVLPEPENQKTNEEIAKEIKEMSPEFLEQYMAAI